MYGVAELSCRRRVYVVLVEMPVIGRVMSIVVKIA